MNRKNASFVRQATFLMVAGLIVRIIGLLYRTPMKATIGGLGYGYYGYAYNVYNILLLISGYSIPVAVSKLMAERIAKKQYRNAQRVFWGAVLYILIIGSLAGLRDRTEHTESASEIARVILLMMTPVIFSTFIYNASAYIDQSIFSPLMLAKGAAADDITTIYGVFSGQYMVLINIPVALANATSTAMMPQITGNYATGAYEEARNKIHEAIRMTMFIANPAAVGLAVLAFPIMQILFPGSPDEAGWLLVAGAVSVLFYSLSTITNGVLQGIGKQHLPLRNASISLVINVAVLAALTWFTNLGIYSVLASTVAYSLSMCILNQLSVRKHLDYRNEFLQTYGKPLAAAAGMGIAAWIIYYGLSIVVPSALICLIPAVLLAILIYLILFEVVTKMKEEELRGYPMGGLIVKVLKALRVLR